VKSKGEGSDLLRGEAGPLPLPGGGALPRPNSAGKSFARFRLLDASDDTTCFRMSDRQHDNKLPRTAALPQKLQMSKALLVLLPRVYGIQGREAAAAAGVR